MKKTLLISILGLVLVGLIGFWVYSFLYGSPTNSDTFTNLGIFGQDNSVPITTPAEPEETPTVNVSTDGLRQLTTRPVVGMRMVAVGSTTVMRYVESGTGHIYDIDLTTGAENRVSAISVPLASDAAVSPSGDYVAIRSGYNTQNELVIIDLSQGATPTSHTLPNQVETFTFAFNNELLFTEIALGQTDGKGYFPNSKTTRRLFSAPFVAHRMAWGIASTTPHIIYVSPTRALRGYAYEVRASGLRRLPFSGDALTILQGTDTLLYGFAEADSYPSFIYNRGSQTAGAPIVAIQPDKCVASTAAATYICAAGLADDLSRFPDEWYKGTTSVDDRLWLVEGEGSATQLVYPLKETGRTLDITNLHLNTNETMVYFINRIDKTLWLYAL